MLRVHTIDSVHKIELTGQTLTSSTTKLPQPHSEVEEDRTTPSTPLQMLETPGASSCHAKQYSTSKLASPLPSHGTCISGRGRNGENLSLSGRKRFQEQSNVAVKDTQASLDIKVVFLLLLLQTGEGKSPQDFKKGPVAALYCVGAPLMSGRSVVNRESFVNLGPRRGSG